MAFVGERFGLAFIAENPVCEDGDEEHELVWTAVDKAPERDGGDGVGAEAVIYVVAEAVV